MAINKVIYGGDTLIDLTSDTVTPPKLKIGAIAHAANGNTIQGELAGVYYGTTAPSPSDAPVWIDPSGTANTIGTEDVKYKIYNSVTDLGLVVGSATIVGAWSAMPNGSILICPQEDFLNSELPGDYAGEVEIIKNINGVVGKIEFHGKVDSIGDYRMFLDSSNIPTETWIRLPSQRTSLQFTWESNINSETNYSHAETDGHLVVINLKATLPTLTSWTELKIATIPQGYRPSQETQTIVADNKGVCICLFAKENGDLKINPGNVTDLTSRYFRGCLTYFID